MDINGKLTDALDSSDMRPDRAKKSASNPDLATGSGSQNHMFESLTQVFVQSKEKSPANMNTAGLSPETVKERVDLAFQRVQEPLVQRLSAMSILVSK